MAETVKTAKIANCGQNRISDTIGHRTFDPRSRPNTELVWHKVSKILKKPSDLGPTSDRLRTDFGPDLGPTSDFGPTSDLGPTSVRTSVRLQTLVWTSVRLQTSDRLRSDFGPTSDRIAEILTKSRKPSETVRFRTGSLRF